MELVLSVRMNLTAAPGGLKYQVACSLAFFEAAVKV
jgi:hypothetical protein